MNSSTSSSESGPGIGGAQSPHPADYLRWYFAAALVLLLLLGCVNWLVDPLQFYRRAAYAPVFSENQRYQNPGLARHYDYSTVIIGTSHAENFLPGLVERSLGEKSVKLAISGSSAREQLMILQLAIATGRVEHVVWLLDPIAFSKPADAVGNRESDFPGHLYHEGWSTIGLYLLSLDSLALSASALLGRGHRELETLNAWHDAYEFSEARVLAEWTRRGAIIDAVNLSAERSFGSSLRDRGLSVELNLVRVIRAHPEIRFDLVFPPFSILSYLIELRMREQEFAERQSYKAHVVAATADLPSTRVFDFQAVRPITHDLDNYKDLEHFRIEVNRYVLDSLASGRHQVDPAHYDEVLAEQAAQVKAYRARVCGAQSPRPWLCPRVAGGR